MSLRGLSLCVRSLGGSFGRYTSQSIARPLIPAPRKFHRTQIIMGQDEYSKSVNQDNIPLNTKLNDLRTFLSKHKTVLFTTRAPDGSLHARVMAIGQITPDWKFRFLYDNESYKETEVDNDFHVNIAADGSADNTGWVSIAGKAKSSNDEALVKELYNPTIKAWFADRGDGVHNGEPSDPRISVFEIKVDEIRHFHQQRTSLGTAIDVIASTITGSTATPGSIRTITGEDISRAWAANELKEP